MSRTQRGLTKIPRGREHHVPGRGLHVTLTHKELRVKSRIRERSIARKRAPSCMHFRRDETQEGNARRYESLSVYEARLAELTTRPRARNTYTLSPWYLAQCRCYMFTSSVIKCDYTTPPVHVYTRGTEGEVFVPSRGEGLLRAPAAAAATARGWKSLLQVDT